MVDTLKPRSRGRRMRAAAVLALALAAPLTGSAHAASAVPLGTADSFAVLAGSTITNTGATTITGDIGLCCSGLATTGFGSVTQPRGAQYIGTGSPAFAAQGDLDTAYGAAASQAVSNTVPVDLSLTGTPANPLLPGVYESTAHGAFQINTGLTLDFQGDPNAIFVFQGTTLTTAAGAGGSVNIVNGGATPSTCNIFWQLADATQGVTLGASSAFKGTTLALGASVLGPGATVEGRILTRRSKAVDLDSNTITRSECSTPTPPSPPAGGSGGGATTPVGSDSTPTLAEAEPESPTPTPTATPIMTKPVARSPSGSAVLSGPTAPVTGPFTVSVSGRSIASVTFTVDGKPAGTVTAKPGRTRFAVPINPRGQSRRVHRVTARVTFAPESGTTSTTLRLTYRRPPLAARPPVAKRPPRFTG